MATSPPPMSRRIALVGLSWISADPPGEASDPVLGTATPYSHASAVAALPDLQLVAGCDISPIARDAFRSRWSGLYPGVTTYGDYTEMLRTERPEFVSVVTPDHMHREVVEAAIAAGARGIYCEKPIATTLEDADAIISAVRAAGVTMNVNYVRRWFPDFVEARRLVRSGAVGPLSQIVIQTGGPRSMLFRNHTHAIDLVNYLADSVPVWVWAELEPGFEHYGLEYAGDGGNDPATEPGGNYYIAYANGVRAYVTGSKRTAAIEPSVTMHGSIARILVDLEGIRLHVASETDSRATSGETYIQRVTPRWTMAGMEAGLRDLIDSLDAGREPTSPPESARQTVAITHAILMSQARGNAPVQMAELDR